MPSRPLRNLSLRLAILALASGLGSCSGRQLIPTPNLYVGALENPFADVPEIYRNNEVDVLYVTDRSPEPPRQGGGVAYGPERSRSLAFGSAVVRFGDDVSWEDLVAASRTREREVDLSVTVASVIEKGRFPSTPLTILRVEKPSDDNFSGVIYDPVVLAERKKTALTLQGDLQERLARSDRKEIYVFVHGYDSTFDDAVVVIAELWHFLGRQGVPIAYTWPAGSGGLRGYFRDRESAEFTIFHFKEFLFFLNACPEVAAIHFIAHTSGTDVLLSAAREINIETHGKPIDPDRPSKLGEIILAAPDLDLDVFSQRITAEGLPRVLSRTTFYTSASDATIGFSAWLFQSRLRVGQISESDRRGAAAREAPGADLLRNVNIVDAGVRIGLFGRTYFYAHPAVLSDLILILRDHAPIGAEHGRPLEHVGGLFWTMDEDYPAGRRK